MENKSEYIESCVKENAPVMESAKNRMRLSGMLSELGVPLNCLGYQYLRDAVTLVAEAPLVVNSITKELYPIIAQKNRTTASRVERAMRHSVEIAMETATKEVLKKYPALYMRDRATNSLFIAAVAERFRFEIEMGLPSDYANIG